MLRITLYKHCILNETYANVFSLGKINNETILEKYLATLDSKIFEIDNIYQENSGQFVFDYEITNITDIYDYNYMKVETVEENEQIEIVKILRYCFIQEIQLKNELVYLKYEEDMWHSYIGKLIGINESFVDASRIIDYENGFKLKVRSLPFEYKGNDYLEINKILNPQGLYYAVVEVQFYSEAIQGQPTNRFSNYFLLGSSLEVSGHGEITPINYDTLCNYLSEIEKNKSVFKIGTKNAQGQWLPLDTNLYELGNIYIFPSEINVSKLKRNSSSDFEFAFIKQNGSSYEVKHGIKLLNSQGNEILLVSKNFTSNFKNFKLGTYSSQYEVSNNGTTTYFKLEGICSISNFNVYLHFNNGIYDITNDFKYELPISQLNSEQSSQLAIARTLKENNLREDKIIQGVQTAKAVASDVYSGIESGTKIGQGKLPSQKLRNTIKGSAGIAKAAVDTAADITIGVATQNKLNNELGALDEPIYNTTSGIFGNSSNLLNQLYGIILTKISSENDDFVKKSINNLGYNAYEYLNDISKLRINDAEYFRTNNINFNIISFKSVSCYGSFARNTAKILNSILESGVKIWYNENLQEDNYQVG